MGVVVRWYIDFLIILLIPTSLVLALFLQAASLHLCSFLNVFSLLFMLILCCSKNIRDRSKIEITRTW